MRIVLQGLQAVVSTAAQVAQAARASGVAVGAPSGSPLAALVCLSNLSAFCSNCGGLEFVKKYQGVQSFS